MTWLAAGLAATRADPVVCARAIRLALARTATRPPAAGASHRGTLPGSLRAGCLPVHGRAVRPPARRPCGAARSQRPAGERSMRHQHPGSRSRARPPSDLRIVGKGTSRRPSRSCLEPPAQSTWPSASATRDRSCDGVTASPSIAERPIAGSVRSASRAGLACPPAHAPGCVHHGRPRRRVPLRDVQIAARHADPRTTTIYDRRPQNFDRHAAYDVVAFVAGG